MIIGSLHSKIKRHVDVDLASSAIAFGKAICPDVEFHCVDAGQLEEVYEVVVAIEALEPCS